MNCITKTIFSLFLVALASITIQAQPVHRVLFKTDRTNSQGVSTLHIHRHVKKGSLLSARRLDSNMASKKQALKLARKTRAPASSFKPDTPRLEAPAFNPVFYKGTPSPHKLHLPTMDSKSSNVPSDAPSLVPTMVNAPTDFPNDEGEEVTAPENSTIHVNRSFDISPTDQRMLPNDVSPSNAPSSGPTNSPIAVEPSDAPVTGDISSTERNSGDEIASTPADHVSINLPPPTYVLICLAVAVTGIATYLDNKWRTRRSQQEDGDEGHFVNN